jgi:putative transposase
MQNAFIESFNGRLRDELLNETLFTSLAQARVVLERWRPTTTMRDLTRSSDGRHHRSSPSLATRDGIWRCAMPMAPHQLPSLPPLCVYRKLRLGRSGGEVRQGWRVM